MQFCSEIQENRPLGAESGWAGKCGHVSNGRLGLPSGPVQGPDAQHARSSSGVEGVLTLRPPCSSLSVQVISMVYFFVPNLIGPLSPPFLSIR